MSAHFEKAGNQAQLEVLMTRLLNVGITVCEILTFATPKLRSRPVDGISVTVERSYPYT